MSDYFVEQRQQENLFYLELFKFRTRAKFTIDEMSEAEKCTEHTLQLEDTLKMNKSKRERQKRRRKQMRFFEKNKGKMKKKNYWK